MTIHTSNTPVPNPSGYTAATSAPKTLHDLPPETLQKIVNQLGALDLSSWGRTNKFGQLVANQSLRTRLQIRSVAQPASTIETVESDPRMELFLTSEDLIKTYDNSFKFRNSIKEIVSYTTPEDAKIKEWLFLVKEKYKNNPIFNQFINQICASPEQKRHKYDYEKVLHILLREKLDIKPEDLIDIGLCTAEKMENIIKEEKFSITKKTFLDKNFLGFFAHGQEISMEAFFNIDDHYIKQGIVNIYKEFDEFEKNQILAIETNLSQQRNLAQEQAAFAKVQSNISQMQLAIGTLTPILAQFAQRQEQLAQRIILLQQEIPVINNQIIERHNVKNSALQKIFKSNMFQYAHLYEEEHLHPFYWAASQENQEHVNALLDAGMPIDEVNGQKNGGGLHGAALRNKFSLLEDLLERGANPLLKDSTNKSLLNIVAYNKNFTDSEKLKIIQLSAEKLTPLQFYKAISVPLSDSQSPKDRSILEILSMGGCSESFEYIIKKLTNEQRLDLLENFRSIQKNTLLSMAARNLRADTIQLLLKDCLFEKRRTLLLTHDNINKLMPLYMAAMVNTSGVIEELIKEFKPKQLFALIQEAAEIGKYKQNIFHVLLDKGIQYNTYNTYNTKSLEYLFKKLNPSDLKILLEQEDNTNDKNTPLKLAEKNGYVRWVTRLKNLSKHR